MNFLNDDKIMYKADDGIQQFAAFYLTLVLCMIAFIDYSLTLKFRV